MMRLLTPLTDHRLHVKIFDPNENRYEVPEFTLPRPTPSEGQTDTDLIFKIIQNPFSFTVSRKSTGEKLFDTTGGILIFEEQYIRITTKLAKDPNIYGLGEHTESFRLPRNASRT